MLSVSRPILNPICAPVRSFATGKYPSPDVYARIKPWDEQKRANYKYYLLHSALPRALINFERLGMAQSHFPDVATSGKRYRKVCRKLIVDKWTVTHVGIGPVNRCTIVEKDKILFDNVKDGDTFLKLFQKPSKAE